MKRFLVAVLAACTMLTGLSAFAEDSGSMAQSTMSKNAMSKGAMASGPMSKKPMHKKMKKSSDAMGMQKKPAGAMGQ